MTVDLAPHRLVGLADPVGRNLGFLVPIYSRPGANQLRLEALDEQGVITGFIEAPMGGLSYREFQSGDHAKVGDPGFCAFAFGADDLVWGRGGAVRDMLSARMSHAIFDERPMLGLELAQFLGDELASRQMALRVFRGLAASSPVAAERWRNLSILTPAYRALLALELPFDDQPLAAETALVVEFGAARVVASAAILERVAAETLRATAWKVLENEHEILTDHVAEVIVVDPPTDLPVRKALFWAKGKWSGEAGKVLTRSFGEDLHYIPPEMESLFLTERTSVNVRSFALVDGDGPAWSRQAAGPAHDNQITLVAHEALAARRINDNGQLKRLSGRVVDLFIGEGFTDEGRVASLARTAREAMWLIDLVDRKNGAHHREAVFLRAKASGFSGLPDAQLAVWSQAWRLGLACFEARALVASRFSGGGLADHLFDDLSTTPTDAIAAGWSRLSADFMLLTPNQPLGPDQLEAEYRRVCEEVGRSVGWTFHQTSGTHTVLAGHTGSFDCRFDFEPDAVVEDWNYGRVLRSSLFRSRALILSEAADEAHILQGLQNDGALTVCIRDLFAAGGGDGSLWGLLSAQLRRLSSNVRSKARTHYLAFILNLIRERGHVDLSNPAMLFDHLDSTDLGVKLHLVCATLTVAGGDVAVGMKLVALDERGGQTILLDHIGVQMKAAGARVFEKPPGWKSAR